jgi:adenylate cyclase
MNPFSMGETSMSEALNGELVPVGGGDNIPLIREQLSVGRRESCDICLQFANISSQHCELNFRNGYWYIRDLNSTNGVKVNGVAVSEKLLHPDDVIAIGPRRFTIQYALPADRRPLEEELMEDIMSHSLLERAGLEKPKGENSRRRHNQQTGEPAA